MWAHERFIVRKNITRCPVTCTYRQLNGTAKKISIYDSIIIALLPPKRPRIFFAKFLINRAYNTHMGKLVIITIEINQKI